VKDIAAERGIFENKIIGLSEKKDRQIIALELLVVFVLASGAININEKFDVV
jgi:hypothetical protein